MPRTPTGATAIAHAIHRLLRERGVAKTICPSEVARAVEPDDWRRAMPIVRAQIARLVDRGEVVVTQRGRIVDPRDARGPIRVAYAPPTKPETGRRRSS